MGRSYVVGRGAAILGTFVAGLVALAVLAPGAGAVLVNFGHGQVAGVTPIKGVNPASIPGSYAKRSGSVNPFSANGDLDYHGGPVVHSSAPYLIFWDPNGQILSAEKTDLENYFADSAADSGLSTNVFGVDRQFTDSTGFANYNMTWAASHAITDTQAYPTTGNCTATPVFSETVCLTDSQLKAEVARLVAANGLPTDGTPGAITANAPIYEVVTPPTVNSCFDSPPNTQCADNRFCAYHSAFTNGGGALLLYANLATVFAGNQPKDCQDDGNSLVQAPNANQIGDVATKYMSHETNETITDPELNAWFISTGCVPNSMTNPCGNEDGDNCNFFGSTANPFLGNSPNAFEPTLGGTAGSGNLFDQVINGGHFYTQTEWSNGNVNCEAQPAPATLSPAFTVPSGTAAGSPATFDPSASTSTAGYTSESWNFGDGTTAFAATTAPTSQNHTYSAPGSYTVTLTMVDTFGNVSTASHAVSIHPAAVPALAVATTTPVAGSPVAFNGSGSSEPGGSITGYSWNFGDGSAAGTGATPSHTYSKAGTYTVTLTVTDGFGSTASASKTVAVIGVPTAKLTLQTVHPVVGGTARFSGASSTDIGSTITSYRWRFGDGGTASGPSATHTYTKPGAYDVTLTIADGSGAGSAVAAAVTVTKAAGIARAAVKTGKKVEQVKFILTGAGTLKIGPRRFKITRAGSLTFKYKLSKSQLKKLHSHHSLTIKLRATFTPSAGKPSSRTITIKIRG